MPPWLFDRLVADVCRPERCDCMEASQPRKARTAECLCGRHQMVRHILRWKQANRVGVSGCTFTSSGFRPVRNAQLHIRACLVLRERTRRVERMRTYRLLEFGLAFRKRHVSMVRSSVPGVRRPAPTFLPGVIACRWCGNAKLWQAGLSPDHRKVLNTLTQ